MRYLKTYQVFESEPAAPALTEDQKSWLNSCTKGSWKLSSQIAVDVDGDFDCSSKSLTDLKGVKFGKVSGSFSCYNNQLTSLEGAPQTVGEGFHCGNNQLTSLKGAPQTVCGSFNCDDNQLTSLEGAPQSVGGSFYCDDNPVSEETLASIFTLMKTRSYQQALEEHWPEMGNDDRTLMYKQMPNLPPEEVRKYRALATVSRIKGYL